MFDGAQRSHDSDPQCQTRAGPGVGFGGPLLVRSRCQPACLSGQERLCTSRDGTGG